MKARLLLILMLLTGFMSCSNSQKNQAESKNQPNLLFVFADQYRRASLGFLNEDPVFTPNIDKLTTFVVF